MVAEMELSKVDNKTKLETTLQEEAAIKQDNKDREMERLADAAEKAARVTAPPRWLFQSPLQQLFIHLSCASSSMQEEELELEAASAKAEQAAHAETLRDTAPVLDANKVTTLRLAVVFEML